MIKVNNIESEVNSDFTKKTYKNIPQKNILIASKKLFELMDKKDIKFIESDDSLSVSRYWSVWAVVAATVGYDYWFVSTKKGESNPNNTEVSLGIARENKTQTSFGLSTFADKKIVMENGVYQIFWKRLDYLLGLNDEWMDCKASKIWLTENKINDEKIGVFCYGTKDTAPNEPIFSNPEI